MRRRSYSSSSSLPDWVYGIAFILILIGAVSVLFVKPIVQNSYEEVITVTAGSTEVKTKPGEETQTYLVSVMFADGTTEVLQSTDSLVHGKWNSADIYFKLKDNPGAVFKLTVVGVRSPVFSMNRNIIAIEGPINDSE